MRVCVCVCMCVYVCVCSGFSEGDNFIRVEFSAFCERHVTKVVSHMCCIAVRCSVLRCDAVYIESITAHSTNVTLPKYSWYTKNTHMMHVYEYYIMYSHWCVISKGSIPAHPYGTCILNTRCNKIYFHRYVISWKKIPAHSSGICILNTCDMAAPYIWTQLHSKQVSCAYVWKRVYKKTNVFAVYTGYRMAKTHKMPLVAGHFLPKSH